MSPLLEANFGTITKRVACAVLLLVLSGCRSVDPTAGLSPAAEIGSASGADARSAEPVQITATAPAGSIGPVQFLPVVGAPEAVARQLSAALAAAAAQAGVGIAPSDAQATPLRLKGYLSALAEDEATVVVYVWDLVNSSGERISRIQGQERVPRTGQGGDPWADVSEMALSAIARRTMDEVSRTATRG